MWFLNNLLTRLCHSEPLAKNLSHLEILHFVQDDGSSHWTCLANCLNRT